MPRFSNPQNFLGQKLVSREQLGLNGISGIVAIDVDDTRKTITPSLMPTLKFQGKNVGNLANSINIIGVGNVSVDENGNVTLRLGENLNSSLFNNTDGTTTGTAEHFGATTSSVIVKNTGAKESVWKKGSTNKITATTAGKIHFNADGAEAFKLTVTGGTDITSAYVFGAITGAGYYAPAVYEEVKDEKGNIISTNITTDSVISTTTAPSTAAYLYITGWQKESNEDKGATGYQANMSIIFDIAKIIKKDDVNQDGIVNFKIEPLGMGSEAKEYSKNNICYYLTDTTTKPKINTFTAKLTSASTVTYGGVTSLKSGTVTYTAEVADLNNPATDASNGASIQINNTADYAGDIAKGAQTTYDGTITKTASMAVSSTGSTYSSAQLSSGVKFIAWNINGSTELAAALTDNAGKAITAIDHYSGTPNSSILGTGNRKALTSTDSEKVAYVDASAPGATDLMVYHGALQYPSAFISNSYYANTSYVAPSTTGDKEALFWFSAAGTEKGGTLTINGSGLTTNVKSVVLGNSVGNLLDITSTAGIGTAPSKTATKLTFPYTFKTEADEITAATGCWVKIVLSGSGAKITSITRG